jgi:hypothetical protein
VPPAVALFERCAFADFFPNWNFSRSFPYISLFMAAMGERLFCALKNLKRQVRAVHGRVRSVTTHKCTSTCLNLTDKIQELIWQAR